MIVHVNQIKTGIKIEYSITGVDGVYTAKAPVLSETGDIELTDAKACLWRLRYKVPPLVGKSTSLGIPFGFQHRINEFLIMQNEEYQGKISHLRYDKVKTRYDVSFQDRVCRLYPLLQGTNEFLLAFLEDNQIAHIKRDTFQQDLKDHYIIYLPDEYSEFLVPMILFVLYYDHCEHGNRREFKKGAAEQSYGYSFGEANTLYEARWMKEHFPSEPRMSIKIDAQESEKLGRRLSVIQLIAGLVFIAGFILFLVFVVRDPVKAVICTILMIILNIYRNRHTMG